MRLSNKKSLLNKATLVLLLLFLLNTIGVSADTACTGLSGYDVVAGQASTIIAYAGTEATVSSWAIIDDDGGKPVQLMNPNACSVDFLANATGEFVVKFKYGASGQLEGDITVNALSSLDAQGFGHYCYAIDTANCGDIKSYGDVIATNFLGATDIIAEGNVHAYGSITVGDYSVPEVSITPTLVKLPNTEINNTLGVANYIYGLNGGGIIFGSDLQTAQDFYALGPSYLYELVEISNPSGTVTVTADLNVTDTLSATDLEVADDGIISNNLDVLGVAVVDNLTVSGDAMFDQNVRVLTADNKFLGPVNLRPACDAVSPQMYQDSNGDFVIELGTSGGGCDLGEPCLDNTDCSPGNTCQDYFCEAENINP